MIIFLTSLLGDFVMLSVSLIVEFHHCGVSYCGVNKNIYKNVYIIALKLLQSAYLRTLNSLVIVEYNVQMGSMCTMNRAVS